MSILLAGKPGVGGPFIEGAGKGLILETPERKKSMTNATNTTTTNDNHFVKYTFYIKIYLVY